MSLTKEIQQTICKAEIKKGNHVAENISFFFVRELDVCAVSTSGYVSEFEVKISRADFKADCKKVAKFEMYANAESGYPYAGKRIPNYFTYVCTSGIITENDLQPYMGLIYFQDGLLITIRKPKLIHRHKHDSLKLLKKMFTVLGWLHYFGAQRLTLLNREAKGNPELENAFLNQVKHIHNER